MLRNLAAGLLLLLVVVSTTSEANAQSASERWMHPCTSDGLCVPRRLTHGFYETRWRQWPAEAEPHSIKKPHTPEESKAEEMPSGEAAKSDKDAAKPGTPESENKTVPGTQKSDHDQSPMPPGGAAKGSPDVMEELEKPGDQKADDSFPENKVPAGTTPESTKKPEDDPNRVVTPGSQTPSAPAEGGTATPTPTRPTEVKPPSEPADVKPPAEPAEVKPPADTDFAPAPDAQTTPSTEPKAPEHNLKPMEDDPFKDEPIPDGTSRRSEGLDRSAHRDEGLDRSVRHEDEDMTKGAVMRWRSPAKLARRGTDAFKPSASAEPRRIEPLLRARAGEQAVGGRRLNPLRGSAPSAGRGIDRSVVRTSAIAELDAPRGHSEMAWRSNPLRSN